MRSLQHNGMVHGGSNMTVTGANVGLNIIIEQHGTLAGHIIPGSMFLLWSTWWLFAHTYRVVKYTKQNTVYQVERSWFQFKFLNTIEPIVKILLSFVGVMIELWWGQDKFRFLIGTDGYLDWRAVQTYQHGLMFFSILISGFVDLLGHFRSLPYGIEYAFLGMAFFGEATIISLHLMGTGLDTTCHFILCMIGYTCALFTFLEPVFKNSPIIGYGRILAVYLQGSWFIQIGQILYTGKKYWNPQHPAGMMYLPVVLVLHILFISLWMLSVYVAMDASFNYLFKSKINYEKVADDETWTLSSHEKNRGRRSNSFNKNKIQLD